MPDPSSLAQPMLSTALLLSMLTPDTIRQIDDALLRVGAFGEVRLVVNKGRLRFIQVLQSESVYTLDAERKTS